MNEHWHLRKELSIGTIISLTVLGVGALAGYLDTKALAQGNSEKLEQVQELPARIARIEEQMSTLREQQVELKRDLANSSNQNRESQLEQLAMLNAIQIALARLQAQLENE